MQFPLMGHRELPPQHLVPLHSNKNDSNLLKLAEGNLSIGSDAASNSQIQQLHHCASQGPEKLNKRHISSDSSKAEIEVRI